MKIYSFLKESCSYISGNRNPEKICNWNLSYISENVNPRKNSVYFRKRSFFTFQETELSDISGKLYTEPWYIQNSDKFRTRSIFRTRGIFKIPSNIYDGMFCENSYLAHFLILPEMKLYCLIFFLYFRKGLTELEK